MNDLVTSRRLPCEAGKQFPVSPLPVADSRETTTFINAIMQRTDELLQKFGNPEPHPMP
jgi:hypothetical protein